jgi:hypothetical protein
LKALAAATSEEKEGTWDEGAGTKGKKFGNIQIGGHWVSGYF